MRRLRPLSLLIFMLPAGCSMVRSDEPLVDVRQAIPGIVVDIRYATPDNFMKHALYPINRCLLRESVAERLALVQQDLHAQGLALKVYDGYRPLSVQKQMWAVMPDERYVANPAKGSRHNRAAAVDVTLVDTAGRELEMPCPYDEFGERAHTRYPGANPAARANRDLLIQAMQRRGFAVLETEWWHYDGPDWQRYPVLDVPLTATPASVPESAAPTRRAARRACQDLPSIR